MQRKWWTLLAVNVAVFMLLLDITVVNTALPSIQDDLKASFTDLQWVVDAYTLSLAALVLTAGSLADRLGRRLVFVIGLAIFTAASLLCALSPDATFLNVARAVQGVGGAAMFGVSLALIAQEFPSGKERGTALGLFGATIGAAVAIGPLVGGALTDGFSWEAVFYLNLPVGLAAIAVTLAKVRETRNPGASRIDWGGLVTFSLSLFGVVLALLRGNDEGWSSTLIVSLFAASAVLMAVFLLIETRIREPMLPLEFFRIPSFAGAQIAAFAISASQFALFLYLTFFLQNFLGLSPFQAGVRYLPISVASFVVAALTGSLMSRFPARVLISVGLFASGAGLLLMSGLSLDSQWTALLAGFLVGGVGIGLINPVVSDLAVSTVPDEQAGTATGINDTFRQVGVSVGIAAWGAIFLSSGSHTVERLTAGTPSASGERPRQLVEAASQGGLGQALQAVPANARDGVEQAARQGFLDGLNDILLLGGGLAIAGGLATLLLVRSRDMRHDPVTEAVAEPVTA